MFLSSYRNTRESLGELEKLWKHLPAACVPTAFLFSQTFTLVSIKQLDYELEISIAL